MSGLDREISQLGPIDEDSKTHLKQDEVLLKYAMVGSGAIISDQIHVSNF